MPNEEKLYTKEEVVNLMKKRVERSHQAFFKRYGVTNLKELDEVFNLVVASKKRREQDLIEGKLTGADALKAQREIGLENMKEVDNQGLIVDSIGENIKTANVNLTNINNELQNHPDIILLKQQIKADEEIRNKYVDLNDTGETLKKCFK